MGPRLAEPGLRWAPATLLVDIDASIFIQSSDSEKEQGILTALDGLLVRLHGFRLSLASRAKNLPSHHNSDSQLVNPNSLWMKDDAGSWYLIRRSLPVEQDKYLTDKTLAEIVQEGDNMWVIYPHSMFPQRSDSKGQSSVGLIVEVETEEEEAENEETAIKKTHAKLHINIAPVQTSTQAWLAAATAFSAQLASNSFALRKIDAMEIGRDEHSSSSSSFKATAIEELASEIHRMASNEDAKAAIVAAGNEFSVSLMEEFITMVVEGQYVCMRETVPRTQRWCVD